MKHKIKKTKKRKLKLGVLILLTFNLLLLSSFLNNTSSLNELGSKQDIVLKSQDISADNIFSGIGAPLNITHWANRTDSDLPISFDEGDSDTASIPLGSGWNAYQLDVSVNDLIDERNWNNGTFAFGNDDGDSSAGDDDTSWIINSFQNWTFGFNDTGLGSNTMSGNYLSNIGGHDCLELRMDDYITVVDGTSFSTYDPDDRLWWNSSISIPRGKIMDSTLNFDLYPNHLAQFNSWAFAIYINDIQVYSIGTYTLLQFGVNSWHSFSIPQSIWINNTNVFPSGPINNQLIEIRANLECIGGGNYSGFSNDDFQRLYFDNLELVTKAEALPSDLNLRVNQTAVQDIDWGKGIVTLEGDWQNSPIIANFSCTDVGVLGSYSVDLQSQLNLFASKDIPETNYETETASLGTSFQVGNESTVDWEFYGFIAVPTGYSESEMKIEFPSDMVITAVYTPEEPSINILNLCDDSLPGILSIPVNSITSIPDGFWKFNAVSPNYCEDLLIFGNSTGSWQQDNEFISGDFVNITAKILDSSLISPYIQNTMAQLQIRFPNGSLWDQQEQYASLDLNGYVNFNPIRIPTTPPNYEEGQYEVIITWNNTHSTYGLNETGIIYKTFRVIHYSKLSPEQEFFENILEGTYIILKASFNDLENFDAVEGALVYTYNFTHPSTIQYFSETAPGFYILEFGTIGGIAGNNTITIYANSTNYVNTQANITIDIIKETTITVDNDFLTDIPYKSNFTIQFNYTEFFTGGGIDPTSLSTDWVGEHSFIRISQGVYSLVCNASGPGYDPGNLYTLIINLDATKHIPQSIPIRIFINELESNINLYINGTEKFDDELISVEVWQQLNLTVKYTDAQFNHLGSASVKVIIGSFVSDIPEVPLLEQYSILINATDIGQGIDYLSVIANITFYNPQSIRTILEVTERLTQLQIYLNSIERTSNPSLDIPIGTMLNITIKYQDTSGNFIDGADLSLSGDYSDNLIENLSLEQYSLMINSSDLDIGVKIITIAAEKFDFEYQTEDLRIVVRRFRSEIITVSGEDRFIIRPGESIKLEVVLNNTDLNDLILGAEVKYSWPYGTGDLIDSNGDGVYEVTIENIPVGSFTILITAFAGDEYEIEGLSITVSAIIPEAELALSLTLLFVAIGITIAVGIYIYLYRTIFRFPKKVRTIRKYRKTLNKEKAPSRHIDSLQESISEAYNEELANSQKILKSASKAPPSKPDKLIKKIPLESSEQKTENE
jgi:hypothetical protein